jgi:arabinose-5-phosphate isomerase
MPNDKCSLDTTATIADVIDSLTNTGLGVVLITDSKNNLKGIITDGDLRRSLRGHMPSLNMCAIDLMNVNYVSIAGASTLSEGLKFLSDMNYRCAPVIDDDNNCIGAINMSKLNSF